MRVSFCVVGVAFSEDPSCVDCHFAWQAQYLGHFRDCNLSLSAVARLRRV